MNRIFAKGMQILTLYTTWLSGFENFEGRENLNWTFLLSAAPHLRSRQHPWMLNWTRISIHKYSSNLALPLYWILMIFSSHFFSFQPLSHQKGLGSSSSLTHSLLITLPTFAFWVEGRKGFGAHGSHLHSSLPLPSSPLSQLHLKSKIQFTPHHSGSPHPPRLESR